jgi:hypothetical protein
MKYFKIREKNSKHSNEMFILTEKSSISSLLLHVGQCGHESYLPYTFESYLPYTFVTLQQQ